MYWKAFLLVLFTTNLYSQWSQETKKYNLTNEPVDVFIACHEKDKDILPLCIKNIKKYGKNVRRVIVGSDTRLTNDAEWFDESKFSFSKKDLQREFASFDNEYFNNPGKTKRVGWYFKQICNFYAPLVIPEISSNVLILDADTVFLQPVEFVDDQGNMLHAPGTENHLPYFEHMSRILPGLIKVIPQYSGISHHMLFQRAVLKDLLSLIEGYHKMPFWKAYCHSVDKKDIEWSGSADYEIYFNFVLMRTNQIKIRPFKWDNISKRSLIDQYQRKGYDFVSWHSYARQD